MNYEVEQLNYIPKFQIVLQKNDVFAKVQKIQKSVWKPMKKYLVDKNQNLSNIKAFYINKFMFI